MESISPPPVVELRQAVKAYRRGSAEVIGLDRVDLQINPGEFVAVTGASGSGKSTLLNVIGTLDLLDAGQYRFEGRSVEELDDQELSALRNHRIGFVFQQFHLLSHYTALENVELPLIYQRLKRREQQRRALEVLEQVGLSDRLDHLPTELSGGQQQRVAIARALVNHPALILADEPTGALDSSTSREILSLFHELNQKGVTIVMVTHDSEVARQARRQVRMKDARTISDESTDQAA